MKNSQSVSKNSYVEYKGDRKKISRGLYCKIVNRINEELVDILITTGSVKFPFNLGSLYIVRQDYSPYYINGQLKGLPPVDWKATKEYNKENNTNIKIRFNTSYYYIIKYKKGRNRLSRYKTFKASRYATSRLKKYADENIKIFSYNL